MTIRKKRILSLIIACAWFVTMQAQVIFRANLDEALKDEETDLTNSLDEFTNWELYNCIVKYDAIWQCNAFQVNNGGYVITPAIGINKTQAKLSFYARSVNTDNLNITVSLDGTGTVDNGTCKISNSKWQYFIVTINNANSNTKIHFKSTDESDKTFMLYYVIVEYNIFHETFNNMPGKGGNDGDYDGSSKTGTTSTSDLDNNENADLRNVTPAKGCIFMDNIGNYKTATLSQNLTSDMLVLSFRAAGNVSNPGTVQLSTTNGKLQSNNIVTTASKWKTYKVAITELNTNNNCQITFKGDKYFLDDVKLYYPASIALNEASDNSSVINLQAQEMVNANLTRTLTGGTWNTLCLPFAIDQGVLNKAVGTYNETAFRILKSVENDTFSFESPTTGSVPAGTPCLIKPTTTVTNPTFKGVTIEATVPTKTTSNGYGLYGTYSPIELATNHTHAFLSSDQRLYYPGAGQNTMNGMRAYFVLPSQAQGTRIQIGENSEQNGIKETCNTDNSQAVYDLSGRKMRPGTLQQGIYIINGKKTIIR